MSFEEILDQALVMLQRIFPPHFAARQAISEGYLNPCSIM